MKFLFLPHICRLSRVGLVVLPLLACKTCSTPRYNVYEALSLPYICRLFLLYTIFIYLYSLAASYSCGDNVSTTIGAEELNYCVRDGNRCDLFAITTRLYDMRYLYLKNQIRTIKSNILKIS